MIDWNTPTYKVGDHVASTIAPWIGTVVDVGAEPNTYTVHWRGQYWDHKTTHYGHQIKIQTT